MARMMCFLLAFTLSLAAPAASDDWPVSTPEEQGMDSAILAGMIESICDSGKDVHGVAIIRHGHLVCEAFFYPYRPGIKHAMYSCTKSFVSALAGAAIEDGQVDSVESRVLDFFTDLEPMNLDSRKRDMKLSELLSMTSGLDWKNEGHISTDAMNRSPNWTKYALDLPMGMDPGKVFLYSDGSSHIAASILQRAVGKSLDEYAAEKLGPLGMDLFWAKSPEGVNAGHSGIFIAPRDAAKFGYLFLKRGLWDGKRLIPEGWVSESTAPRVKPNWSVLLPGYGYYWWIPRFGGYAAIGAGGNHIYVMPEKDLVAVFTGGLFGETEAYYPSRLMENYVLPSIKDDRPLMREDGADSPLGPALARALKAPAPNSAALSETAHRISGKKYILDDGSSVTLRFDEGSGDFLVTIDSRSYAADSDGLYRIVEAEGGGSQPDRIHLAIRGAWTGPADFELEIRSLESGTAMLYSGRFSDDAVSIAITSNYGYRQTVFGRTR